MGLPRKYILTKPESLEKFDAPLVSDVGGEAGLGWLADVERFSDNEADVDDDDDETLTFVFERTDKAGLADRGADADDDVSERFVCEFEFSLLGIVEDCRGECTEFESFADATGCLDEPFGGFESIKT